MGDTVLSAGQQLEIISRLQDRAIVRRNIQTEHDPSRTPSAWVNQIKKEDLQQRDNVAV